MISEKQIQKIYWDFPPLHPWCRCTFTIEVDDWDAWMDEYERKHGKQNEINKLADEFKTDEQKELDRKNKDFVKKAQQFQKELHNIIPRESLWSGNIILTKTLGKDVLGATDWNGDIRITQYADDTTILHEIMHTYSALHITKDLFDEKNLRGIEEATVAYFAENYMKEKGELYHKSYTELTDVLYRINRKLNIYDNDLEFAKALMNIPIEVRCDWLQEKVKDAMIKKNASIQDINAVVKYIGKKFSGRL